MTKKDISSPAKEDKPPSRRLSLHRKTPSTGSATSPSASSASISPKAPSHKGLLQSPAKRAAGILNAISPGRRRSEPQYDAAQPANMLADKGVSAKDGRGSDVDASVDPARLSHAPEATKSLEHLSMEDSAKSSAPGTTSASPPPDLPSVIAGGKLAINRSRPLSQSPPALPPRNIYEVMKPMPPKHIEDTNDGMVVDPSLNEHLVEPELIAVEDADPPPPPLIYEVEDDGTPMASLQGKESWDTKATVEPVDYNMWDDSNSVPMNYFSEENTVDNSKPRRETDNQQTDRSIRAALGLSDGIQAFHLTNRSADLETHNQLGSGMTYLRMLTTGIHMGHHAVCVKPANEQTSSLLPPDLVQSAISSIPRLPQTDAESKYETHWIFCIECAGWFRVIGGLNASEQFLSGFQLRTGSDADGANREAESKLQAIGRAVKGSKDHKRPHHFHAIADSIPQSPSADIDIANLAIPLDAINDTANLSSYHCCYCGLFLAYDTTATVRSIFPNDLLDRLFKRDPIPGDTELPIGRFYRTLKLLHT